MTTSPSFDQAVALMDAANAADPQVEVVDGVERPKELLYAERMSAMVMRFKPSADEVQQLAVRGHHIERWTSPRDAFPKTRVGYLQWRTALYAFHAERVAAILAEAGYDEAAQERAKKAVGKKQLKQNADSQLVEDAASLVFVEYYLKAFADKHPEYDEEKWIVILGRTWKKMSEEARAFALAGEVRVPEALASLFQKAIAVP